MSNSFVYFIESNEFVKIGTTKDVHARIRILQTGSPFPMKLVGAIPGNERRERDIHKAFEHSHAYNEWFHKSPELMEYIDNMVRAEGVQVTPGYRWVANINRSTLPAIRELAAHLGFDSPADLLDALAAAYRADPAGTLAALRTLLPDAPADPDA